MSLDTFDYRVQWPSGEMRQGEHRSSTSGDGGAYRGDRLLREVRDARQISLRSTLRDPFKRLWVREYLHSATIDLWVLLDGSASMRLGGGVRGSSGVEVAGRLIRSAALSAGEVGDRLGVFSANDSLLTDCCSPPSRLAAQSLAVAHRVEALVTQASRDGTSGTANGLLEAVGRLGARRSLVFLVSDFHPQRCDWSAIMRSLTQHDVVPVVYWCLPQALTGDRHGLMSLRDAETGLDTMVWMRRSLRQQVIARLDEHFEAVNRLCRQYGRRAVHLYDGFDPVLLTRYFYGARGAQTPGMRLSQLSR